MCRTSEADQTHLVAGSQTLGSPRQIGRGFYSLILEGGVGRPFRASDARRTGHSMTIKAPLVTMVNTINTVSFSSLNFSFCSDVCYRTESGEHLSTTTWWTRYTAYRTAYRQTGGLCGLPQTSWDQFPPTTTYLL